MGWLIGSRVLSARRRRLGRTRRLPIIVATAVVMAAGCATPVPQRPFTELDAAERRDMLRDIAEFRMEGRLALKTGRRGYSGTVSWDQNEDVVDFRFRGPFGFGGFRIHGDAERLRVKTTGGDEFLLTDPEREMTDRFGWSLPVYSMRYWILGVSDPEVPADEAMDDEGLLNKLEQAGWRVRYDSYDESHGLMLPRRMEMEHGDVRIKVMADRWDIPGSALLAGR
ncbi:MAG: lipoprotein insertase outer membrane protein LolB [Anaerolineae bacterium]